MANRHVPTQTADYGDYAALIEHMTNNHRSGKVELMALDTGDLVEGTGLSDATQIHGQMLFPIASKQLYTATTDGNHDIEYNDEVTTMKNNYINNLQQRFLSSNTKLSDGKPLGNSYYVYTTEFGRRVLLLGYIFNFLQHSNNTRVIDMDVSVQEAYFKEAMTQPNIDIIITLNHIDPQGQIDLLNIQYNAIRKYHPNIPLVLLTGHAHKQYFSMFNTNAFTIESGKYFEVIGHITFDVCNSNITNVQHEWIPTNLDTFYQITGTTSKNFDTPLSLSMKQQIQTAYKQLDLGHVFGCAPATYIPELPDTNSSSAYYLLINKIMPYYFLKNETCTQYFITNTATIRSTIYQGTVTRDDIFSISPFKDRYMYFEKVSGSVLQQVVNYLADQLNQDKIKLHHRYHAFASANANWYFSPIPIGNDQCYDVIAASYDSDVIQPILNQISGQQYQQFLYHGAGGVKSSTDLLVNYISTQWPCQH